MKNSDLEVMEKVLSVLVKHLSPSDPLVKAYKAILYDEHNAKKTQGYQRNPAYHIAKTREWEKKNPEKRKEYTNRHTEKKKAERIQRITDLAVQGKTVTEMAALMKLSEKAVINSLTLIINDNKTSEQVKPSILKTVDDNMKKIAESANKNVKRKNGMSIED
jgi:DNA-binding NarL/FixJ family response regulator